MKKISKNVIYKHLEGRASILEKSAINDWMQEPENQEQYFSWLEEWESQHLHFVPDVEAAYDKFLGNTVSTATSQPATVADEVLPASAGSLPRSSYRWWAAAAVLVVATTSWLLRDTILYKTYKTGYGQIASVLLPDSSEVILNANTEMKIARLCFLQEERAVMLNGEAVFNVVHTKDNRPFLVYGQDGAVVQVLGTEFDMYSRGKESRVVLHHGSVRFTTKKKDQPPVMMKPGEMIRLKQDEKPLLSKNEDFTTISAWREREFVFNGTSLGEIATILQEQFGKKLVFENEEMKKREVSGSYHWVKEEAFLSTLSEMMHFSAIYQQDSIIIK